MVTHRPHHSGRRGTATRALTTATALLAALVVATSSVTASAATAPAAGAGTGLGTGPGTSAAAGTAEYVALGDSYAAVGRIVPGVWTPGPISCARTADAYPTVLARELGVGTFVNASCAGAVSDDLWAPDEGVPAQFDALTENTDLVTLSIGGNDAGFGAVIIACAVRTNTASPFLPVIDAVTGSISEDFDPTAGCSDVLDRQAPAALAELDAHLDEVYAEISRRSPGARVVTTGYLGAIPGEDATIAASPACAPLMAATREQRDGMRDFQNSLNDVVRDAAERNGAIAVIPNEPGHSMCTPPQTRWVDLLGIETGAAPIHPTTAGQAHVADRVLTALRREG